MITAEASTFLVPVPRPLLLRIARFLDTVAGSISDGANLPEGWVQRLLHADRNSGIELMSDNR